MRLRSCGAELYRGAVFSLLFIGCYEVEQGTGSKFGPHNMLNPFSSATSKCPVQQPIENWQLKDVFKTIFSLFFLLGGWRGNERSQVATSLGKSRNVSDVFWNGGGTNLPNPRTNPPHPVHPLHRTTPFLWSHIFYRFKPIVLTVISPPRRGLVANQLATKKSHRH